MHRSIITIRSNTQWLERLSGVSFPIITPKGLPPTGNNTWGCTTFTLQWHVPVVLPYPGIGEIFRRSFIPHAQSCDTSRY